MFFPLLDSLVSVVDGACPSPVYGKACSPNIGQDWAIFTRFPRLAEVPLDPHDQTRNYHHNDRQHHPVVHDQYAFHSRFGPLLRVLARASSEFHAFTGSDDRQQGGHRADQRG
jgi:hypothetical protein